MTADGAQVPGGGPRADSGPEARAGSGPWPLVLPLALLIILGMAGLRGSVVQPRWNGPWHRDGVAVGIALEVLLGVLLVMTLRRRSASLRTPPVAGTRWRAARWRAARWRPSCARCSSSCSAGG